MAARSPTSDSRGAHSFAGATTPAYCVATAVIARAGLGPTDWTPLAVAGWIWRDWLALLMRVSVALARRLGARVTVAWTRSRLVERFWAPRRA